MKTRFLILLIFPLLIFACANNTQTNGAEAEATTTTHQEHHAEAHAHQDNAIQLDNGQAWKVDENMMEFIKKMDNEVASFSGKTYNDYQVLAMDLMENIDGLTSNCTMTGQAHDELHKWLLPYIDLVNDFAKTDNVKDAQAALEKIKSSFKTFNQYFS